MIKTIPNSLDIFSIRYTPSFSVICTLGKAPFHGMIEIEYYPSSVLLEFESFEELLRSIAMQEYTIESFTRLVFDLLTEALGDIPLRVTVHGRTTVHAPASATIKREKKDKEKESG